jgi:hypothetical protein
MLAPALQLPKESLERKIHALVPTGVRRADGVGPAIPLGDHRKGAIVVSLGIHHVVENTRLAVSIWGSPNGEDWGERSLLSLPPKSYCGIYTAFLDASVLRGVRYLRATWKISRCASVGPEPFFGFTVTADESGL